MRSKSRSPKSAGPLLAWAARSGVGTAGAAAGQRGGHRRDEPVSSLGGSLPTGSPPPGPHCTLLMPALFFPAATGRMLTSASSATARTLTDSPTSKQRRAASGRARCIGWSTSSTGRPSTTGTMPLPPTRSARRATAAGGVPCPSTAAQRAPPAPGGAQGRAGRGPSSPCSECERRKSRPRPPRPMD